MQRAAAGCLAVILFFGVFWVGLSVATYGGLVKASQRVDAQWERVCSRVGALVQLAAKRSPVSDGPALLSEAKLDPRQAPLEAKKMEGFRKAHELLRSALTESLAVAERDSASDSEPSQFRIDFVETENQYQLERKLFNELVQAYNSKVSAFPTVLVSGVMGFIPKALLND